MPVGFRSLRWHILLTGGLLLIVGMVWNYREPLRTNSQGLLSAWMPSNPTSDGFSMIMPTDDESAGYDLAKQFFQAPLDWYGVPEYDTESLRRYKARNHKGPGHETFATFYATRDGTTADPYFMSTQQIIYRLLWDPASKSDKHPITVFVAPFVPEWQRDTFRAAGALVRELPLVPFKPDSPGVAGRLQDMFSKIEMWRQTEFSKIAYLDGDAFPIKNIDDIFDMAPLKACKEFMLPQEDRQVWPEICTYTFAAYQEVGTNINAGVLVFNPNEPMYRRLIRLTEDHDFEDKGMMEQSLLNHAYHELGPFPPLTLPHAYNGGYDLGNDGKPISIVHAKLWAMAATPVDAWEKTMFEDNWKQMLELYKSDEFPRLRMAEGLA